MRFVVAHEARTSRWDAARRAAGRVLPPVALAIVAACSDGDGGAPDRAAWLGDYDAGWACASAPCAVMPDVAMATTATIVADPQSADGIHIVFAPVASSSGIIGRATPSGDRYRIAVLFDGAGAWGEVILDLTATGFSGTGDFTPAGGAPTTWTLTATGPR